ncbi:MAG: T3SS effector HopA1 family protein [Vicinamibacteria bacterium]
MSATRALPDDLEDAVVHAEALAQAGLEGEALGRALYGAWYGAPRVPEHVHRRGIAALPADLTGLFRAAHADAACWEDGFVVTHVATDGRVRATRDGEERELARCDYVAPGRPGTLPRPGHEIRATVRRDVAAPGSPWWYTHRAGWRMDRPPGDLVRFYFHTAPGSLAALLRALTRTLATSGVPWMVKCAVDPQVHARADAVVAFVQRTALADLQSPLTELGCRFRDAALSAGPPCTLAVVPGVAVALDPGEGRSFGEHRSRLVAAAVADAGDARDAVWRRFEADGIDPFRPWRRRDAEALPWER